MIHRNCERAIQQSLPRDITADILSSQLRYRASVPHPLPVIGISSEGHWSNLARFQNRGSYRGLIVRIIFQARFSSVPPLFGIKSMGVASTRVRCHPITLRSHEQNQGPSIHGRNCWCRWDDFPVLTDSDVIRKYRVCAKAVKLTRHRANDLRGNHVLIFPFVVPLRCDAPPASQY